MMRIASLLVACLLLRSVSIIAQPILDRELYASGFDQPVDIASAGDDRMFIVERAGTIRIIDASGITLAENFLDITSKIESGYDEQGLLGLVFSPDYDSTGYFFVFYTDDDGNDIIARYKVSDADSNIADPDSEQIIFSAVDPYVNHNAGDLNFGPDGYLYFGMGDGGSAGDPGNRAQDPEEKLGKMHRIDVTGEDTYSIPSDNPYFGSTDTLESIWDIGMRNPWRFSFDRLTGDMWIGEVGQNLYEEIDFEPAGTVGGFNYGWRCYEADDEFNTSGCEAMSAYDFPIFKYFHSFSTGGYAMVGGFVYRGSLYPGMNGYYIFGDNVSGNWWTLYPDGAGSWTSNFLPSFSTNVSTFGEMTDGEIYYAELYLGKIYHVIDNCGDFAASITADANTLTASSGVSWQWYLNGEAIAGATTQSYDATESGDYTVSITNDIGCTVLSEAISLIYEGITMPAGINSLEIYPNPVSENLILGISTEIPLPAMQMRISDLTGKIIYADDLQNVSGDFEKIISVHDFAAGMYKISLLGDAINWNRSFVVNK